MGVEWYVLPPHPAVVLPQATAGSLYIIYHPSGCTGIIPSGSVYFKCVSKKSSTVME
jgi:hypothetical protein